MWLELVGRGDELPQVLAVLRGVAQRGDGAVVLVTGEAGLGKTAFMRAAAEQSPNVGDSIEAARRAHVGRDLASRGRRELVRDELFRQRRDDDQAHIEWLYARGRRQPGIRRFSSADTPIVNGYQRNQCNHVRGCAHPNSLSQMAADN